MDHIYWLPKPENIGAVTAETVFDSCKEVALKNAIVIGTQEDGSILVAGTNGIAPSMLLLQRGIHHLMALAEAYAEQGIPRGEDN